MSDVLVRGKGLRREFGNGQNSVVAVAEATFEIREGDCIALVGPSGSGKTSLLHLIAGLDQPSAGVIEWPALGSAEDLRPGPVSIAFQGPSLLPPLTVSENLALPALLAGGAEADATAAAQVLIGEVGLSEVASKLPEEISGGQAQRAGVARALMGRPRLILADEPTGRLDTDTGSRVLSVLLDTAARLQAALVVSTHDEAVAGRLTSHWEMSDGRLVTAEAVA